MAILTIKRFESRPNPLEMWWGTFIPMATVQFMRPWFEWVRTGKFVNHSLRCMGIMGQWTVIRQLPCDIPKPVWVRYPRKWCGILTKTRLIGYWTLTTPNMNQPFYRHVFLTCLLMGQLEFLLVMRRIFHLIIWEKSSMPFCICKGTPTQRWMISCSL